MFAQGSTQSKTTYKVALNYRNDIEMLFLKYKVLSLATAVPFLSLFCHIPTTPFGYLPTPEPAFPQTPLHYQRHSSTHISFLIATPQTKARSKYKETPKSIPTTPQWHMLIIIFTAAGARRSLSCFHSEQNPNGSAGNVAK
jgi:hypothetical protein